MLNPAVASMYKGFLSGNQDKKKISNKGSRPTDWEGRLTPFANMDSHNEMGFLRDGVVMVDVDDNADEVLRLLGRTKCNIMKTNRGLHAYFKRPMQTDSTPLEVLRGIYHSAIWIPLEWFVGEHEVPDMLILNGEERLWIRGDYTYDDLDELPMWLWQTNITVAKSKDIDGFPSSPFGISEGRNEGFGKHWVYLLVHRSQIPTAVDIRIVLDFINEQVFGEPQEKDKWGTLFTSKKMEEYERWIGGRLSGSFKYKQSRKLKVAGYRDDKVMDYRKFTDDLIEVSCGKRFESEGKNKNCFYNGLYHEMGNEEAVIRRNSDMINPYDINVVTGIINYDLGIPLLPDKNTEWITCANGDYNILTGELAEHSHTHNTLFAIPTRMPIEEPKENLVDSFLDQVTCGHREQRMFLEEMAGYMLYPTNDAEAFFILLGGGRNGKTTFLELMIKTFGDVNTLSTKLEDLSSRFGLGGFERAIMNISGETSRGYISSETIKLVTSTDKVRIEEKNIKAFSTYTRCKCMFATNSLPHMLDASEGMKRRIKIIEFMLKLTIEEQDVRVKEVLRGSKECHERFLWLAVKGLERLVQNGLKFTEYTRMQEAVKDYVTGGENLIEFVRYVYEDLDKNFEKCKPRWLFTHAFDDWSRETKMLMGLTMKTFESKLKEFGYGKGSVRNGDEIFKGYKLDRMIAIEPILEIVEDYEKRHKKTKGE